MFYRKKPVVIEAVKFTPELALECLIDHAPAPFGLSVSGSCHPPTRRLDYATITVATRDGRVRCVIGDWIIKDDNGCLSVCDPLIFEGLYEPAEVATDKQREDLAPLA